MSVRSNRPPVDSPPLLQTLVDGFTASLEGNSGASDDVVKWREDPEAWMMERMHLKDTTLRWSNFRGEYTTHSWDGTPDPFYAAHQALAEGNDVGLESGTGTGKTYWAALVTLWFLDCFENSQVITLAPKGDQLKLHMWKEINKLWPTFKKYHPTAMITTLKIHMRGKGEDWAATGFPVQVRAGEDAATKAQGFHAKHMLFIMEEFPGIDDAISTAVKNTCTAPHNLRLGLGNPDHTKDALHKFCKEPGVIHIRVSALDHPNVVMKDASKVPGAVSIESIKDRETEYGLGSRMYQSRVRGICPAESVEAIIRMTWCRNAQERTLDQLAANLGETPIMTPALGVDVANSESGDKAASARGRGPVCDEVTSEPCPDANLYAAERVQPIMTADNIDEQMCGIDGIGVGAGAVNEMKRLGYEVIDIQSSAPPVDIDAESEKFGNLRSQMWWQGRLDLQHGRVIIPDDEELVDDLTTPRWESRGGKIYVESKKELIHRLRRSPNKGDAWVYWNWIRQGKGQTSTIGGAMVNL